MSMVVVARRVMLPAQRDPTLAENVIATLMFFNSASTFLNLNCYIQHPSALFGGNISKPLSSVSELTSLCMLFSNFPLT